MQIALGWFGEGKRLQTMPNKRYPFGKRPTAAQQWYTPHPTCPVYYIPGRPGVDVGDGVAAMDDGAHLIGKNFQHMLRRLINCWK